MYLSEYVRKKGSKSLRDIDVACAGAVSYNTIWRASQGTPISWAKAKVISEATGGAVSIEELCNPEPVGGSAADA